MITLTIPRLPGMKYAVQIKIKYAGWGEVVSRAFAGWDETLRRAFLPWRNLPPRQRPHYPKHSKETWDRRNSAATERRKALEARKGRKK